jgi:hypothetical protein
MPKVKNMKKQITPPAAGVQAALLNATSTEVDAQGQCRIVLYWNPVPGMTGYNLYRADRKGPLNGKQPIAQVTTCAQLQVFVPEGSKAWQMLSKAFDSVAGRNAVQIVADRLHRGRVVDPSGLFAGRTLTVSTSSVQEPPALLPPQSDPCVVIQRGLAADEQALFDNLASANLPLRLARGWAYIDSTVVSGTEYSYELRGLGPGQHEVVLARGVLVTAGQFRLPPYPSGFQLVPGDSQVLALWNRNGAAFSYTLQRAGNRRGPFLTVNNSPILYDLTRDLDNRPLTAHRPGFIDSQSWNADGLPVSHKVLGLDIEGPADSTRYYYRVASCDILERHGDWSPMLGATPLDTTPPMAPADLQVNPYHPLDRFDLNDSPGLVLTWRKVTRDIKGHQMGEPAPTYRIYRSDKAKDLNDLGALPAHLVQSYVEALPDPTRLTVSWTDHDPALQAPYGEKDFWYRIACVDMHGNTSAPSAVLAARLPDTTAPGPSQVTGADGFADHIIVYWLPNTEPDLAGYQIYRGVCDRGKLQRGPNHECDFVIVGNVPGKEAGKRLTQTGRIYFEDFSVPAGSPVCYAYWVRAYDHSGNLYAGHYGCPVDPAPGSHPEYACQRLYEETPPPVPVITGLKARDRAVQVEWVSAPVQDLRAFHIYRSEDELDPPVFVGCVLNDGTVHPGRWTGMKPDCEDIPADPDPSVGRGTFLDQTVEPSHIYWYRVSALDWLGNESGAADLTEIPAISTFTYDRGLPLAPLVQPAGASSPDKCGLDVTWTPAFNPLAHKGILVFRSRVADGGFRQVSGLVQADHFEDLSARRGIDYWYLVQAMALDGTLSQPSAPVLYRY